MPEEGFCKLVVVCCDLVVAEFCFIMAIAIYFRMNIT
jgi:hypothetical protein